MNLKKNKIIKLVIFIIIPLGLGSLVGYLSGSATNYNAFIKPIFAPPGIVFPIVWTILYSLMGVSAYIISETKTLDKNNVLKTYYIQLIINLLWSFIFFTFKLYLLSTLWIILLIIFVVKMIIEFYTIKKVAGLLQLPYLLWLIFALVLNITIYILN